MREVAHGGDVDQFLHRVGRRLEEHDLGRPSERGLPLGEVVPVDEVGHDAPARQDGREDLEA